MCNLEPDGLGKRPNKIVESPKSKIIGEAHAPAGLGQICDINAVKKM